MVGWLLLHRQNEERRRAEEEQRRRDDEHRREQEEKRRMVQRYAASLGLAPYVNSTSSLSTWSTGYSPDEYYLPMRPPDA